MWASSPDDPRPPRQPPRREADETGEAEQTERETVGPTDDDRPEVERQTADDTAVERESLGDLSDRDDARDSVELPSERVGEREAEPEP